MTRLGRFAPLFLALTFAACSAPESHTIDYAHPDQQIMAVNLASNYVNHPNVADRDHTRKVLEVTGHVMRLDSGHVVIGSAEKGEVWCAFEGGSLPGVQVGQEIVVIGYCKGKNGHVLLDQCRLKP